MAQTLLLILSYNDLLAFVATVELFTIRPTEALLDMRLYAASVNRLLVFSSPAEEDSKRRDFFIVSFALVICCLYVEQYSSNALLDFSAFSMALFTSVLKFILPIEATY